MLGPSNEQHLEVTVQHREDDEVHGDGRPRVPLCLAVLVEELPLACGRDLDVLAALGSHHFIPIE
jgi:hypothetical protein